MRRQQHTTVSAPSAPVFGRGEECNSLINMLITEPHDQSSSSLKKNDQSSSKKNNVPVHAIYGLGGAGKTTLAQYIYKDERVEKKFDSKIWVHVTRTFDAYRITKEIIESVLKGESSPCGNLNVLQEKLMEVLKSKRFLLVLDDVWHVERDQWDQLLSPLNEVGEVGSRILITTRTEGVALMLGVKSIVPLKELKTEDCWSIVKHYASREDPKFEDVGKRIAKKLKNSPLAARVVGSSLANKKSVDEWKMFLKDDSILKDTIDALYLSFQQLSPTLQRCFAYCSLYPKGFAFSDADDLVRMWIAQGFIEAPSTNDLAWEEKGRQCFNDLLSNSFFQIHYSLGKEYVIHDLLHDLAEEVSKGDCFRIEDEEEPVTIPDTIIHLSIATRKLVVPIHDILKLVNLRSFIILSTDGFIIPSIAGYENTIIGTKKMLEKFKRLRVLHFRWEPMSELNSCIGQLNHLRYFQMRRVKKLPKSFSRLYHLQFFLLDYEIDRVPKGMSNLVNYRGIRGTMTEFHSMIPMVGKLTSLQTLEEYHIKKNSWQHGIEQLKSLQQLRGSLTITGLENVKDKAQAALALLNKKKYLEKLRLEWDDSSSNRRAGEDEDVIEGLDPHPNLKELAIRGYEGAKLPSWYMLNHQDLQTLELINCPNLTAIGLPPNLIKLRVFRCHELMQLSPFSRSVEYLIIVDCPGFEALLSSITTTVSNDGGDENNSLQPFSLKSLWILRCSLLDEKTHSASLEKFNSLSELYLEGLPSVTSLLLAPNLRELTIENLPQLNSMGNLQLLTSLERLTVYKCPKLKLTTTGGVDDGLPSFIKADLKIDDPLLLPVLLQEQGLNSLEKLIISNCSRDIPFTAEQEDIFLRLTSLKVLSFDGCNLPSLPVNLEKLSSLEDLTIVGCPEIKSLPNLPTCLKSLSIILCTQLVVKYRQGGPLRHKIHHIPYIHIR